MGVLTIATAATITALTSNEHSFGRDRQTNRALNIAEAGLNAGLAAVKALPVDATSLSPASGTVDQGSWSYTATRAQDATDPDVYNWTITGTGISPDTHVTRIVSTKVKETVVHTSTTITHPASPAYKYGFFLGDPGSDCTTTPGGGNQLSGQGLVTVSVYARGSLCFSGNGAMLQPTGTQGTLELYVGKKLSISGGSSFVGTSSAKIKRATVVGGCIKDGSAVTCSSSSSSKVYAQGYSSTQYDIVKPPIDTAWYTNAKPGPTTGCNNDPTNPANKSTYPSGWTATQFKNTVLDGDGVRNTSVGTIDILGLVGGPAGNFDCRYYNSSGNLLGRFAWTWGFPGTLTIEGTVFIDGNLSFTGTDYAKYSGRGTIYANGKITFDGQALVCATPVSGSPCAGNFNPSQNLIALVAVNAANANPGFSLSGSETYEGVAYTNGVFYAAGGSTLHGPVIADTANMSGNGSVGLTIDPPPGAPGDEWTETVAGPDEADWDDVPGSWQQLK